ncbi:MAG: DUF1266 domain-containing protein [Spirochaetaceae bacterium]|nr:DUF1266 domain-containing protein [Spirochaetaceae bacterium]
MKKFFTLAFAVLTTCLLCAEQPFFLKNWIIPESVRWGTTDRIPAVEGAFIEQTEFVTEPLTELTIYKEDFSKISVPPYFSDRKLLGWEMSYADILVAFKTNKDFSVEERAKYQVFNYFNLLPYLSAEERCIAMDEALDSEDCVLCDAYLNIFPKNFSNFYIQLGFVSSSPESLMESFKVIYCMDDSTKPYKVLFEQNNRAKWEALTETEKLAVALSAVLFDQYELEPCVFDATPTALQSDSYIQKVLKESGISKKEDLVGTSFMKTYFQNMQYNFNLFWGLLDSNPGKTAAEIATEYNLSYEGASLLFFLDDMKDTVSKYDAEMIAEVTELMWLRLGAGVGYYSHDEAVEAAGKIAKKLIKEYVSFEDLVAHISLVASCLNLTNDDYLESSKMIMDAFDSIKKSIPVEEIVFDGSEADRTAVLKINDAYYKPEKHANWVEAIKILKHGAREEGLLVALNCINEYGNRKWFEGLYEKIENTQYFIYDEHYTRNQSYENFFDEHYSRIWNKTPEMEQYAIAFSSNLFELNGYFHLDFSNKFKFKGERISLEERKRSTKESWGITDHKTLVDMIESLNNWGHSGSYNELLSYIKKYPGKTPIEIGELLDLSILDVSRLYFVKKMDGILGKHGIEAWDEGRSLTLLRWGINFGYISADEAMALSVPIINKIRDNYTSWEDFMAHYIAGRCFWGLSDSDYKNLADASVDAAKSTRAYVPYEKLYFTSEYADVEHKMTLEDCYYNPTDEALVWENVQKLYQKEENAQVLADLTKLEKENPAITNIVFYWHLGMLIDQKGFIDETLNYIENHMNYLNSLPEEDGVYVNSLYYYLVCLNSTSRFEECINLYSLLPDSLKQYAEVKYQYAYPNLVLSYNSDNPLLVNIYRRRAYETFKEILEMEIQLDDFIIGWMEAYQNNTL